jgi:proteasome accessory factor B
MAMPVVERLVNLTVALLETRRPLTFDELRRRTNYYPQPDAASARRMFERDKETLRSFGVPIETRQEFGMDDPGYLIDRRAYELRDIGLDADEVAALALAVEMLGQDEVALPLAKVAARAPDPAPLDAPPTRVRLSVTDVDRFAPAIVERRVLRFSYRTADGRSGVRTVEPYGIVRRRRAWYLVGRDRDRGQPRGFRTDRMLEDLEVVGPAGAFEVPDGFDLGGVVTGPEPEPVEVVLAAGPEGGWALGARGAIDEGPVDEGTDEEGPRRFRLSSVDPVRDRAWLLGIAPDAAVLEPPPLRSELRGALEKVRDLHGSDAEGCER